MKRYIISLLFGLCVFSACAQTPKQQPKAAAKDTAVAAVEVADTVQPEVPLTDSARIASGPWKIDTLKSGLILKTIHFAEKEYMGTNQYIAVLEIPKSAPFHVAFAHEPVRTYTSTMARKQGAVAAINGSFFDMRKHNPICYLKIDGKECGINTMGTDTIMRKYYQYGSMSIRRGRPVIMRTKGPRFWERSLPDTNIMTAGPLLIHEGVAEPQRLDKDFITQRHNRTAIATKPDGTTLFFVVDGRTKQSEGFSIPELISTLMWMGCTEALNLDGGGSTTLYVKGQQHGGIVNYPTDNGKFDHEGERKVSNAVLLLRNPEPKKSPILGGSSIGD